MGLKSLPMRRDYYKRFLNARFSMGYFQGIAKSDARTFMSRVVRRVHLISERKTSCFLKTASIAFELT